MLLRDADISAESPKDVDDENVTHQGLSPTLPEAHKDIQCVGTVQRFTNSRQNTPGLYPALDYILVVVKNSSRMSDELEQWSQNLPSHLHLQS